ncbi:MAG: 5'-methylthioadenosine/S-adenosylhomocysteine nucleosidase [Clostridia bacterium]|nr:5'-methylthioadenosine/S-adenosylhomocysteine nucleosidase [Clostridia bacterium]
MKTIGLVIADEYEYLPFLRMAANYGEVKESTFRTRPCAEVTVNENRVVAVSCGIGKVAAATAAAFLIADEKADYIFNIGLSGAVSGLHEGEIALGSSFAECDFDLTAIGRKQGENPSKPWQHEADKDLLNKAETVLGVKSAAFGCGDLFLADPVKKDFFKDTFNINAFDMETGAIASVCGSANVPFLSLRQMSDSADDASAETYTAVNNTQPEDLAKMILKFIETI